MGWNSLMKVFFFLKSTTYNNMTKTKTERLILRAVGPTGVLATAGMDSKLTLWDCGVNWRMKEEIRTIFVSLSICLLFLLYFASFTL